MLLAKGCSVFPLKRLRVVCRVQVESEFTACVYDVMTIVGQFRHCCPLSFAAVAAVA
jgi:hypothetical protein